MPYDIPFKVNSNGYSAKVVKGLSIMTELPGGMPRVERDFMNVYYNFAVNFELNAKQYNELKKIYDDYLLKPEPVIVNLISFKGLRPHSCWILPDSWSLDSTNGYDKYVVSLALIGAQL